MTKLEFKYEGPIERGSTISLVQRNPTPIRVTRFDFDPQHARSWFNFGHIFDKKKTQTVEEVEALLPFPTIPGGIDAVEVLIVRDDAPELAHTQLTLTLYGDD